MLVNPRRVSLLAATVAALTASSLMPVPASADADMSLSATMAYIDSNLKRLSRDESLRYIRGEYIWPAKQVSGSYSNCTSVTLSVEGEYVPKSEFLRCSDCPAGILLTPVDWDGKTEYSFSLADIASVATRPLAGQGEEVRISTGARNPTIRSKTIIRPRPQWTRELGSHWRDFHEGRVEEIRLVPRTETDARRLANAFEHAAKLCREQNPTPTDPFD
jgi:hypothetical protein